MSRNQKTYPVSADSLETFIFEGLDGEECEDLIHAVRLHARKAQRMKDDEYMARWAAACMVGKALRWYIALPREVKYDWEELEQALAAEYQINNETRSRPSPGVVRRGRLKVVSGDLKRGGYISYGTDTTKKLVPTASISEALNVEWSTPSNDGVSQLRLLNQAPIDGKHYDLLGISYHKAGALDQGDSVHGSLTPATTSPMGTYQYARKSSGEQKVDIWRVAPDGFISMHWDDGTKIHQLIATAHDTCIRVMNTSEFDSFNARNFASDPSVPVRLFLEPLA